MNWQNNPLNIGTIKENKTYDFEFVSTKTLDIVSAKPGCGSCTTLGGYVGGKLKVSFRSSSIPQHLNVREQRVEKSIVVTYRDKTTEVLKFVGTVVK